MKLAPTGQALVRLEELASAASAAVAASLSPNTRRAYASTWRDFEAWCGAHGLASLPAEPATVALYVTSLVAEGLRASSLDRALAAISTVHRLAGHPSPRRDAAVSSVRKAFRRQLGVAPEQKAPILAVELRRLLDALPGATLAGLRDRALLTLGWHGAFRRSELVSLDVSDLSFDDEGLRVRLRRDKGDQEGAGRVVGIPYGSHRETCPVRSLRAYLEAAQLTQGPVFQSLRRSRRELLSGRRLSDQAVCLLVHQAAKLAGIAPERLGAHSLRAGLVTEAARHGKPVHQIMKQTRHKTLSVLLTYMRDADLFRDNAAAGLGT